MIALLNQTQPEPSKPLSARRPHINKGGALSFQVIVIWVLPKFHSRPCAHMTTNQTQTGPAITTAILAISSSSRKNAVPSIVTEVRRNQPLTSLFVSSSHLVGRITPTMACTSATRTNHIWGSRIVSIPLSILGIPIYFTHHYFPDSCIPRQQVRLELGKVEQPAPSVHCSRSS